MKKLSILLISLFIAAAAQSQWTTQSSGITSSLNSIFFIDASNGFTAGDGGKILKTTNGGTNWTNSTSGTTAQLNSIFFTSASTGYVVGGSGMIRKTTNTGTSWSQQTSNTSQYLYGLYFADASTGYAVGWSGTIVKTSNGGTTWATQTSNVTAPLYGVFFTSTTTGYAVGGSSSSIIIKTTDGGTTWNPLTISSTYPLRSVYFTSTDTGYVAGNNGIVFKTTDGGANWTSQNSTTSLNINSIFFPDANTGFAACASGYVTKTTNGGSTWSAFATPASSVLMSAYFVNASIGYVCGASGTILKTTVGGVNCTNTANAGPDKSICSGSSTSLLASGGVSYSWSPSTGLSATNISNPVASPTITTVYTVTVTQANTCSSTDQVTVTVNPAPTIEAGNNVTVCPGEQVTLTASGGTSYTWTGGVQNGVAFTPSTTTVYTVTGTSSGCNGTDNVTVTVRTAPPVDAGSDVNLCQGEQTTLTASGASSYSWSNSIQDGVAFTPTVTTTYFVTGTDANGCTNTDGVTVTVNSIPVANAGTDQSVCLGSSASLSASGGSQYSWSPTTGLDNSSIANPLASPSVNTTYTVTVTSAGGCTDTDAIDITVIALPTADAGSDSTICTGSTIMLNATGGVSYSWSPSAELSDANVANPIASPSTSTVFTVTVTSADGCTDTDSVSVSLNPLPIAEAGGDTVVCAGENVTLTGSGGVLYTWSDGVINGVPFAASTTQNYFVTVTDINGCSAIDSTAVTVNPIPLVDAGADQTLCPGDSTILIASGGDTYAWNVGDNTSSITVNPALTTLYTVTVTGGGCTASDEVLVTVNSPIADAGSDFGVCEGDSIILAASGGTTYVWDNGVVDGAAFVPLVTTTYSVTSTDDNGCTATDEIMVTVSTHPPTPVITISGDSLISDADSLNQWYVNESIIQGATENFYIATTSGDYYVIVTIDGCSSDTSNIITIAGLDAFSLNNEFNIYPNPANEMIEISINEKCEIEILSIEGKLIESINNIENKASVNITDFARGIYLVKIKTAKGIFTRKFIKE